MKEIVLGGAELLWLMDQLQVDRPIGVEISLPGRNWAEIGS